MKLLIFVKQYEVDWSIRSLTPMTREYKMIQKVQLDSANTMYSNILVANNNLESHDSYFDILD